MRGLAWWMVVVTLASLFHVPPAEATCHIPPPEDCGFLEDDSVNKLYAQAREALGKGTLDIHIGVHHGQPGTMNATVPTFNEEEPGVIQYSIEFHANDTTNGTDHPVEFEIMPGAALTNVTLNPLVFTFSSANGTPQQWYHHFDTQDVAANGTYPFFYRLTAFKGTPDEHVVAGRLEVGILDDDPRPTTSSNADACPAMTPSISGSPSISGTVGPTTSGPLAASLARGHEAGSDCSDDTPLPLWAPLGALGLAALVRRRL